MEIVGVSSENWHFRLQFTSRRQSSKAEPTTDMIILSPLQITKLSGVLPFGARLSQRERDIKLQRPVMLK
jgi:hypothetical protein